MILDLRKRDIRINSIRVSRDWCIWIEDEGAITRIRIE